MARIRTVKQALDIIKLDDPDTAITEYLLRKMISNGDITSIKSGNKYLVDVDLLIKQLYDNPKK